MPIASCEPWSGSQATPARHQQPVPRSPEAPPLIAVASVSMAAAGVKAARLPTGLPTTLSYRDDGRLHVVDLPPWRFATTKMFVAGSTPAAPRPSSAPIGLAWWQNNVGGRHRHAWSMFGQSSRRARPQTSVSKRPRSSVPKAPAADSAKRRQGITTLCRLCYTYQVIQNGSNASCPMSSTH